MRTRDRSLARPRQRSAVCLPGAESVHGLDPAALSCAACAAATPSPVAYFVETLHFSTGKDAELRDARSGGLLSRYGLERVDGEIPSDALKNVPPWVREIPDIER